MKKLGKPKIYSLPRPFKCGCGHDYIQANELYRHFKKKHPGGPPKGSYLKKKIGRPIKNKSSKKKRACGCGKVYNNVRSLRVHIRSKHKGTAPPNT